MAQSLTLACSPGATRLLGRRSAEPGLSTYESQSMDRDVTAHPTREDRYL